MKKNYKQKILYSYNICFTLLLGLGFQSAFAQNTCATASTVSAGTHVIDVINGTNISTSCSGTAQLAEWFAYTPTSNHSVTITSDLLVNICKDTHFSIYTGTCGVGQLTCLDDDDDSGVIQCNAGNTNSYLSKATIDMFAGVTYYIAWDNRWGTAGFTWQIIEAPYVPSVCYSATTVIAGVTTVPVIDSPTTATACSTATLAEWYRYIPTQNYKVTVTSDLPSNLCKDTNFNVYRGTCPGLICVVGDDNSGVLECDAGSPASNLSKRTFEVTAGTTYYIAWDNKWSTAGFDFEIKEEVIVVPVTYTAQTVPTIQTGAYNICVVDMNGDYKDDVVGISSALLRVHHQGNAGTLAPTDYAVPAGTKMPGWSMAAGDFNKDGFNDLLLGDSQGLSFLKSNATGTAYTGMTPGQYIFCQRTNFVDLNRDGHLDAFSCHDIDPNVYYINNGSGNFTYYQSGITEGAYQLGIIMEGGNYASLWFDYDNDGDSDMFISKCSGPPCELHRNDGNHFTDISAQAGINVTPIQSWSSAIADFDNDGDMDILIGSNGGPRSKLFRNDVNPNNSVEEPFVDVSAGSGWDSDTSIQRDYIAYDFDNDGFVDVMGGGSKIMFNRGGMYFEPSNYPGIGVGPIGDLNNDGFLDILSNNVIRYAVPNGNNWIKLSLKGIQSNSNGIGARVEIYGVWGKQIRDVRSGEGFEYMSSLNTHFGIGTATAIQKMVIKWPSGVVDTILNPGINQTVHVVEASTLGISDVNSTSFSVYPNPASDVLNIRLTDAVSGIKSVEVYDINGRMVVQPSASETVSVKSLSAGTYILLLKSTDGKQYTQKFLKK